VLVVSLTTLAVEVAAVEAVALVVLEGAAPAADFLFVDFGGVEGRGGGQARLQFCLVFIFFSKINFLPLC